MIYTLFIVSAFAVLMTMFYFKEKAKSKKVEKQFDEKFKKLTETLSDDRKLGYYNINTWTYGNKDDKKNVTFNIFVEEIDRYTNGDSKIKIDHIEILNCPKDARYMVIDKATVEFSSVKKTSEIEWLESEEDIRELRRKKLKAIENLNI